MSIIFARTALRDLQSFPRNVQRRIVDKMEWFALQENPLAFAKPLTDFRLGTHRFRIGVYRVFVEVKRDRISVLFVLAIRHRENAYKV
ncbi:MAG: type II toxin-antitoxin system RelE/ParE family toxin [Candidatus Peregrinibacteria bacterium]